MKLSEPDEKPGSDMPKRSLCLQLIPISEEKKGEISKHFSDASRQDRPSEKMESEAKRYRSLFDFSKETAALL